MCDLPAEIIRVLSPFAPVFSPRVWAWATTLLVGAILAPGPRTDQQRQIGRAHV